MSEHETQQHRLSPELGLGEMIGAFLTKRRDIKREISDVEKWQQSVKLAPKYNLRKEQMIDSLLRLQDEILDFAKSYLESFLDVHPELIEEYEELLKRHQELPNLREEKGEN